MTKEIPLNRGFSTIVDDADYNHLMQWNWYINFHGYACRTSYANGRKQYIYLHRELLQPAEGMHTDHINGNRLDNRRENLRSCYPGENLRNKKPPYGKKYKGLRKYEGSKKTTWSAFIRPGRVHIYLGRFDNYTDAARAYNQAAIQLYGEFAFLNPEQLEG